MIRYTLGALLLLIALNAFAGGIYGMAGAKEIPVIWLKGSIFPNYFLPGLFLFVVVGGASLFAAFHILFKKRFGIQSSFFSGLILIGWIAIQVAIIGYVSWMQPAVAALGFFILLLSWILQRSSAS